MKTVVENRYKRNSFWIYSKLYDGITDIHGIMKVSKMREIKKK